LQNTPKEKENIRYFPAESGRIIPSRNPQLFLPISQVYAVAIVFKTTVV
jgi:hypothetical protein